MAGVAERKLTKNEKRRLRKKAGHETQTPDDSSLKENNRGKGVENGKGASHSESNGKIVQDGIVVEYVSADYENQENPELLEQFKDIFSKFSKPEELLSVQPVASSGGDSVDVDGSNGQKSSEQENTQAVVGEDGMPQQPLSKRKKKLLSRLSVAELKQLVPRPDVVEAHDVTSSDPRLLVFLKSQRNTVPVPRHWCHIRKYLTGKVGMDKPPFQLPEFIAETGIAKIRDTLLEQEALKKAKQKSRERVRPKIGKIDIDYQVLHDAFFKYQTKPKLTNHGDLYYEGKEFELNLKDRKPGQLSADLQRALGMLPEERERVLEDGTVVAATVSSHSNSTVPPPWLINMQRYGPPPSYPSMRIPGLNAPLPAGASYGYHQGGWGKPPVDEYGRPLYGDAFGTVEDQYADGAADAVDKSVRWGALAVEEYVEEEEEVEEEGVNDFDIDGTETPSTVDGLGSLAAGMETPDTIDLRKRAGMDTPDSSIASSAPRELYQVIQERTASSTSSSSGVGQMFGSDRTYVLPGQGGGGTSLNPNELEEVVRGKASQHLPSAEGVVTGVASLGVGVVPVNGIDNTSNSSAQAGTESELEGRGTGKKRKADATSNAAKRMKEFKF